MQNLLKFLKKFKIRALIFLAVLGPGIITAVADNDAGGVATKQSFSPSPKRSAPELPLSRAKVWEVLLEKDTG